MILMVLENFNFVDILPTLIGAIGGSFGGNFVSDWLKKRGEKEKLRKEIIDKYLIQFQYIVQSFLFRLGNMTERRGADYMQHIKGNDEYYIISTLYSIGCILAYHRILLFEGIYSQIEYIYPKFGSLLLSKLNGFGNQLDSIGKHVKFFRYDRMTLGDVITERENGRVRICSYLKFKDMCENDDKIKSAIKPAREFVEFLPSVSDLSFLEHDLNYIIKELEQKTQVYSLS